MCVGPGVWALVWAAVPTTNKGFSPLKGLDSITTSQIHNNCGINTVLLLPGIKSEWHMNRKISVDGIQKKYY